MNGIHRWWTWLICGLLFVATSGLFLLFKALKGQSGPAYFHAASSEKNDGGLHRVPVAHPKSDLAEVLQELLARTGFEPEEARDQLTRMGVLTPESKQTPSSVQKAAERTGASRSQEELHKGLEEAVQEGLRWARSEDDHSQAGVEYAEGELNQEFEAILFNPEARDRLDLCSKLLTNLQEMLQRSEFLHARNQIEGLIAALDEQTTQLEQGLTYRTTVRESEVGTRTDRQFCAFQAGVIQHLRGKGLFPELDALYRPGTTASALDYNDQDAFALLKQRCEVFAVLEQVGMQKLLQAGDEEIRAMVERALPSPAQPGPESGDVSNT